MFFRVGFMWLFWFFPGDYSLLERANGYIYPYYFASKKQGKRELARDRRCGLLLPVDGGADNQSVFAAGLITIQQAANFYGSCSVSALRK